MSHFCARSVVEAGNVEEKLSKRLCAPETQPRRSPVHARPLDPEPRGTIAVKFVCAVLGKLCIHNLDTPSGSADGANDSRAASAGSISPRKPCQCSNVQSARTLLKATDASAGVAGLSKYCIQTLDALRLPGSANGADDSMTALRQC